MPNDFAKCSFLWIAILEVLSDRKASCPSKVHRFLSYTTVIALYSAYLLFQQQPNKMSWLVSEHLVLSFLES